MHIIKHGFKLWRKENLGENKGGNNITGLLGGEVLVMQENFKLMLQGEKWKDDIRMYYSSILYYMDVMYCTTNLVEKPYAH